uniref:NADH-ubiquinone oxidoreductase chain 2 n=1 Tax=Tettigonia chinensis TaxID=469653 RepID=A0A1Q1MPJ2_9ORTH|nr:NADH dehydrogenase subunit 2 [Tettigonia chinensis]
MNPAKLIFYFMMILGTTISITANSWFAAWSGLEINLLAFIPLMFNANNAMSTEACLKYFLIQTLASAMLLFSIVTMSIPLSDYIFMKNEILKILICSTLLLKMGAAPFHFWLPGTMEGLNWTNCFILMTWQKVAPLVLLSYIIEMNMFMMFIIMSSIIIGSLGGLNQTSFRKLMAYSSINHIGWMISAMMMSENLWELYFLIYILLNLSITLLLGSHNIHYAKQAFIILTKSPYMKSCLFLIFMSLGGLPPFLGFLPKWLVIQQLALMNYQFLVTIMVVTTLITLFYYLRLTLSALMFNYIEQKMEFTKPPLSPWVNSLTILLSGVSLMGLPMGCSIWAYFML